MWKWRSFSLGFNEIHQFSYLWLRWSVPPSLNNPSFCSFIHSLSILPFIWTSIGPSIYSFFHPSIYQFLHVSLCVSESVSIHPPIPLSIYVSVHPIINPSVCLDRLASVPIDKDEGMSIHSFNPFIIPLFFSGLFYICICRNICHWFMLHFYRVFSKNWLKGQKTPWICVNKRMKLWSENCRCSGKEWNGFQVCSPSFPALFITCVGSSLWLFVLCN